VEAFHALDACLGAFVFIFKSGDLGSHSAQFFELMFKSLLLCHELSLFFILWAWFILLSDLHVCFSAPLVGSCQADAARSAFLTQPACGYRKLSLCLANLAIMV